MGRPQEPLERDGSPSREFAFWLRDLRHRSGLTYEQLARSAQYATSTMQAATTGQRLPTLKVTMAFVAACGGDEGAWRAYWAQVRRLLDEGAPSGLSYSMAPPWAAGGARAASQLAVGGWYVESFTALLRLDTQPVEAMERRRIVTTVDGVSELVTAVSVPRHAFSPDKPQDLESELLYGGFLQSRHQPYDGYFENVIVLPRPLRAGEYHEYGLRLRIPDGQLMNSHYVHIPRRRSDHFELRIRFGDSRPPAPAWVVRAAPPPVIYRGEPTGERLHPDRFGDISVSFTRLRVGLGYGVCWPEPARTSPGS